MPLPPIKVSARRNGGKRAAVSFGGIFTQADGESQNSGQLTLDTLLIFDHTIRFAGGWNSDDGNGMLTITLPDGSTRNYEQSTLTGAEIAQYI